MEYKAKAVNATLCTLGCAIVIFWISRFFVIEQQASAYRSRPISEYILGAQASPPEDGGEVSTSTSQTAALAANYTSTQIAADGFSDETFEDDVDCSALPAFSLDKNFMLQRNNSAVFLTPSVLPPGPFKDAGFEYYGSVFGIYVIASKGVSQDSFVHALSVFARFLDNNEDGMPDYELATSKIRDYNGVVGYFTGPEESQTLWDEKFRNDPKLETFRAIFFCQIHFFEQWASDISQVYHQLRANASAGNNEDKCAEIKRQKASFDWSLWYFHFFSIYYGYLEQFDNSTVSQIEAHMDKFMKDNLFNGNYPNDREMLIADFISWSDMTRLNALDCYCDDEVISDVWKLCTANDLIKHDKKLTDLLDHLSIINALPDGHYYSPAVSKPLLN